MADGLVANIKEQGKAILVMMATAIISILAMIVLGEFRVATWGMTALGNSSHGLNATVSAALGLFITAFGITGSFAAITVLIIVVKVIIGVVRGLKT